MMMYKGKKELKGLADEMCTETNNLRCTKEQGN